MLEDDENALTNYDGEDEDGHAQEDGIQQQFNFDDSPEPISNGNRNGNRNRNRNRNRSIEVKEDADDNDISTANLLKVYNDCVVPEKSDDIYRTRSDRYFKFVNDRMLEMNEQSIVAWMEYERRANNSMGSSMYSYYAAIKKILLSDHKI